MGQDYRSPILTFVGLCFFILSIAQNADTLPYNVDGTEVTDQLLNSVEKTTNSEAKTKLTDFQDIQSDAKIAFPDKDTSLQVPVCKGSTYCEKVDNYPEQIVTEALERRHGLKYVAFEEGIDQRINVSDDTPLCSSTKSLIRPRMVLNKHNQWQYIANQENFKQAIEIEVCSTPNADCNVIGAPGGGYITTCVQQFIYREFATVASNGSMVLDMFKFPSNCCCQLSFTRMGLSSREQGSNATHI